MIYRRCRSDRTNHQVCHCTNDVTTLKAAPVLSYAEVIAEPHMWENGYLTTMEVPGHGTKQVQGLGIKYSGTPPSTVFAAGPELGVDTDRIKKLVSKL
jgi:crotonobetainyl-CoA:carnitine CoA-transferase CaiB-like acyl-CoA transferase